VIERIDTGRRWVVAQLAALAVVCYVPLLLTARGFVAADTKAYLYLDPARLLSRAPYLWDQNVALGTVTHQNIGYLWPMGPWFWTFDVLGVPDWVAQRLWMGTLLFAAGAGILFLGRTIGPRSRLAWTAAAFVYLLSPYVLDYISRISVLLLPWAALPWLVALTELSLRRRRWREPALFALVVATAGGINATALVLVGLGPLLWVVLSVWVHRAVDWRLAGATVLRIGVLCFVTNVWWMAGLAVQSGWGLDVLRYTETVQTVARSSLASEVLRGLGYWFFYGIDKLGPWIEPGRTFTEQAWLIAVGFVLPVGALVAAFVLRWKHRFFAVVVVVLGVAIAVGAYPYHDPSPIGAVFKRFATSSTAGLALRSTGRAVPLVVLGFALLIGAGVAAVLVRRPRSGVGLAIVVVLVALAANPALLTGQFIAGNLRHPEDVPGYWREAAAYLDEQGHETRVLEIPGTDFATYRWGNHVDPITPGLIDRPYVARELIPFGTEASADLVIALDRRIQEGVLDPDALVDVARLMGVGDIVLRGDLEYERYRTARPSQVWSMLRPLADGLRAPVAFGDAVENRATPALPMRDEIYLQTRGDAVKPPVAVFGVEDPMPIVRVRSDREPILFEGDGDGVVDAAGAGFLGGDDVVVTAGALAGRRRVLRDVLDRAAIVVTDTNRKQAARWGTVRDNAGYTERAAESPLVDDASDNRMPLFPDATAASFTTVEQRGVRRVQASAYGNPVSYTPADRPANAFDGDLGTAWSVGALGPVGGQKLLVETDDPVTTDHLDVVQANQGPRRITRVGVFLDGEHVLDAPLGDASLAPEGARIELGRDRTFQTLELVIEADSGGRRPSYADQNGVGISEVRVAGVRVDEVVKLPTALLSLVEREERSDRPLTIVLTRLRANPKEPFARDVETRLSRAFDLPAEYVFEVTGTAKVFANQPDDALDRLLGGRAGAVVRSSGRLPGDLAGRASATVDGDPSTAWTHHFGEQVGAWVSLERTSAVTIDRLDLHALDDGDHSVPTRVTISNEVGESRTVDVASARSTLRFAPLTGALTKVTVDAVRAVNTTDWFSKQPSTMPVALAELGVGALPSTPGSLGGCRDDLLTIDDEPVPLTVGADGTVTTCNGVPLHLSPGPHDLRTAPGSDSGLDLDQLTLSTRPASPAPSVAGDASVSVLDQGRVSMDVRVRAAAPTWLVLGQSWSDGWKATLNGKDLGAPVLVDGFANGWLIDPGDAGAVTVELRWTPQKIVWAGLGISILGALACLAIVLTSIVLGARSRAERGALHPEASVAVLRADPFLAGTPLDWVRAVGGAVGLAVAAGLVVHPFIGVATLPFALAALRVERGRLVGLLAPALLATAGAFTAVRQARRGLLADFGWTDYFRPAHNLAWAALVALVVLVVVDAVRRRND
jgi:arabinofuranan 3-O-arabinosyltransferase